MKARKTRKYVLVLDMPDLLFDAIDKSAKCAGMSHSEWVTQVINDYFILLAENPELEIKAIKK